MDGNVAHAPSRLSRLAEWINGASIADASVLIVDDSPSNVLLLERQLAALGLGRIHTLTDARQAVDACIELRPNLLLLDLHMPYVDGYQVLQDLQTRMPRGEFLPVLVLTADITPEARERALNAGANDFLIKPFDRVEVLQRVRNLIEVQALYQGVRHHNRHLRAELDRERARRYEDATELTAARSQVTAALSGDGLTMAYQPIVDLSSGTTVAVEALARFTCPPPRPPDAWFAEADRVGLRPELELAAIDVALAQLGELAPDWLLSINVSPGVAATGGFAERLASVPADRVVIELTESTMVDDYAALLESVAAARSRGVRFAVDDAGAGYAGLQQILRLRPDIIKLDRDLTRGIDRDPVRRALATSLVSFARETDCTIVAEGIEEPAELGTLKDLGVMWGQGYLLGRPAPLPGRA